MQSRRSVPSNRLRVGPASQEIRVPRGRLRAIQGHDGDEFHFRSILVELSASRFLMIRPGTAHLHERRTCGPIGWTAVSDPGSVPPDWAMRPRENGPIDTFHADLAEVIEFDERLTALSRLIGSVTRTGDYCVHGRLFAPMPRIEAGAAGVLSLPIPPAQAEILVADADRAPYGRGQETIVDPSVRDCRQLEPDKLSVAGRGLGRYLR